MLAWWLRREAELLEGRNTNSVMPIRGLGVYRRSLRWTLFRGPHRQAALAVRTSQGHCQSARGRAHEHTAPRKVHGLRHPHHVGRRTILLLRAICYITICQQREFSQKHPKNPGKLTHHVGLLTDQEQGPHTRVKSCPWIGR